MMAGIEAGLQIVWIRTIFQRRKKAVQALPCQQDSPRGFPPVLRAAGLGNACLGLLGAEPLDDIAVIWERCLAKERR
jgi:hypothetical protein